MRITLHVAAALLYLWVTVGVTVAIRFCAGEPITASILGGTRDEIACCCGGPESVEGCCSIAVTTMRVDDVHTFSVVVLDPSVHVDQIPAPTDLSAHHVLGARPPGLVRPPSLHVPTHLLDCSLLI